MITPGAATMTGADFKALAQFLYRIENENCPMESFHPEAYVKLGWGGAIDYMRSSSPVTKETLKLRALAKAVARWRDAWDNPNTLDAEPEQREMLRLVAEFEETQGL